MSVIDFKITENGEMDYDDNLKEPGYTDKDDLRKQICINRIKSVVGDWFNTTIGADLEQYFGYVANGDTCNKIINSIVASLIYDGFMEKEDIFIIPSLEGEEIKLIIFIKGIYDKEKLRVEATLDLTGEVKVYYDAYTQ